MSFKALLNPFEKYSEKTLLIFGIAVTVVASLMAYLTRARFDGIIDLHFVSSITWFQPLVDNLINIVIVFVIFLIFGKVINAKTRAVDILTMSIISRLPIYLGVIANLGGYLDAATSNLLENIDVNNPSQEPEISFSDLTIIMISALIMIPLLIYMISLYWKGFRTATNSKGVKNIFIFIVLFVLAEIFSKYLITNFNV